MILDNLTNQSVATNLEFLDNVETFLHLVRMVPLMNVVKNLMKLIQACDIFVINTMSTIELYQTKLYEMFIDPTITFTSNEFLSFKTLVNGRLETILMKWITNLNNKFHHLAFEC